MTGFWWSLRNPFLIYCLVWIVFMCLSFWIGSQRRGRETYVEYQRPTSDLDSMQYNAMFLSEDL